MNIADGFEYALRVIALGSAIFGAWYAVQNFESWRREHQGKRQAELAEETLALFYEVADIIRAVRSPMSWSNETDEIKKSEHETNAQYEARKSAYVVFKRLDDHRAQLSKLYAMRYRFMAVFGTEATKPFSDVNDVLHQIKVAGRMLANLWAQRPYRTEAQAEENEKMVKKYENIFWEMLPEDDKITPKVAAIIVDIEKTCRGIIEARGTLFGLLNKKIV